MRSNPSETVDVSVIIPTYKRTKNLKKSILSALLQTGVSVEVIVVDDNGRGSPYSAEVERCIHSIEYSSNGNWVILIAHDINKNGAAARNTGIRSAKGRYIAFLDDDDEFLANKLEKQVKALDGNPDFDACYCLVQRAVNGIIFERSTYAKAGNLSLDILALRAKIWTSTLLVRKDVAISIGGFDEEFERHQDYDFLLSLFERSKILALNEALVKIEVSDSKNRPNIKVLAASKSKLLNKFSCTIEKTGFLNKLMIRRAQRTELLVFSVLSGHWGCISLIWPYGISMNYVVSGVISKLRRVIVCFN